MFIIYLDEDMYLELKFDYYSKNLYIPDGFIYGLNQLKTSFLEWVERQPNCLSCAPNTHGALSYDEIDFLEYINSEVLKGSNEKAYFVSGIKRSKGKTLIISF